MYFQNQEAAEITNKTSTLNRMDYKAKQVMKNLAKATVIAKTQASVHKKQHQRNPKKKQFTSRVN